MDVSQNWRKYIDVNNCKSSCSNGGKRKRTKGDRRLLHSKHKQEKLISSSSANGHVDGEKCVTQVVALDCEMVGVADGKESILARVSIVNSFGHCLYDTFVKPTDEVVDYRTDVSGVRPKDMQNGVNFEVAQKCVADLIKGRILVGHDIKNDLRVLYLSHPRKRIRDTSRYRPFRSITNGNTPSLKRLAKEILGVNLHEGEHSSVEDARAAMQLYNLYKAEWECNKNHK